MLTHLKLKIFSYSYGRQVTTFSPLSKHTLACLLTLPLPLPRCKFRLRSNGGEHIFAEGYHVSNKSNTMGYLTLERKY